MEGLWKDWMDWGRHTRREGRQAEGVGHQHRREPGAQSVESLGYLVFMSSEPWQDNQYAGLGLQVVFTFYLFFLEV